MESIFPKRLKEERLNQNLTQQQLAELANNLLNTPVSRVSINRYENGTRVPDFDILLALSCALNVDTDYLLGKSNSKNIEMACSQLNDFSKNLNSYIKKDDKEINELFANILDLLNLTFTNRNKEELKLITNLVQTTLVAYLDISNNRNSGYLNEGKNNLNSHELENFKKIIIKDLSNLIDKIDIQYNHEYKKFDLHTK